MKVVLVGGHGRKVGKTSVVAGVLRGLKSVGWTAVKITPHLHAAGPAPGSDRSAPAQPPFVLTEECDPSGHGDTCRYLAAGARRALLLSVEPGRLAEALPSLRQALAGDEHVIIESNRVLDFVKPAVCLAVLSNRRRGSKPSARRFLRQADAVVLVESGGDALDETATDSVGRRHKPVFGVRAPHYFSRNLCAFIRRELLRAGEEPSARDKRQTEETLWQR